MGVGWLILVRFIQGLGEGPIVSFYSLKMKVVHYIECIMNVGALHSCSTRQMDPSK